MPPQHKISSARALSCNLRHARGLQSVQVVGGTLRVGGNAENRALVLLQDLKPALNVGRMIGARLRRQCEVGAKKRRAKLGNQFFASVAFVAPLFAAKVAVKPLRMLRPVGQLMRKGRVVGFRAAEALERRHLHMIGSAAVIGPVAAKKPSAWAIRCAGAMTGSGLT